MYSFGRDDTESRAYMNTNTKKRTTRYTIS